MGVRLHDVVGLLVIAALSMVAGLAINRFSSRPISLAYRTPQQRLSAELTTLINAPPFQLADLSTVGLDEFRKAMQDHALVLDARGSVYYNEGHVPGAMNLARNNFANDYNRLRPTLDKSKDQLIVVYCSGGDCHDSRLVASALLSLGFSDVKVFTGGWTEWSAANLPVAR
jgi:rhodanese-related sulfurtransferase